MKLDSYVLRYGEPRDMAESGYSQDILVLLSLLPLQLRSKVRGAIPYYAHAAVSESAKALPGGIELYMDSDAFVFSCRARSVMVPYYLKGLGEVGLLKWQSKLYLKTGFWIEPNITGIIRVSLRDNPLTRAGMVLLLMITPAALLGFLLFQYLEVKYTRLASWIASFSEHE